jgi:hypothetical protein
MGTRETFLLSSDKIITASPGDAGGTEGADDKGGEAISSNLRGHGSVQGQREGKSAALAQWLVEEKSSFGLYSMGDVLAQTAVWERILPKLFTTGENLDHVQIMGAVFLP